MKALLVYLLVLSQMSGAVLYAGDVPPSTGTARTDTLISISNDRVKLTVAIENDTLAWDRLETEPVWSAQYSRPVTSVRTDAGFALDVMYTDWQAPGKAGNADNPVMLLKKDFAYRAHSVSVQPDGSRELTIGLEGAGTTIDVTVRYRIGPGDNYIRRKIIATDTAFGYHFLRWFWARRGTVEGVGRIVKAGGFGQPVAFLTGPGGGFFGLEYPTSENSLEATGQGRASLRSGQEIGEKISSPGVESEWVVTAVTPDPHVRKWFFQYVDDIRVAPLRPYTLYNSWYDLRSPEYPRVPEEHWMSEQSSLKMARLLRENMIEKHGIGLDAFVLDDGWDVYESDWVLRKKEWPRGLKPLSDELRKTNTALGIWVGPTGGYSFRTRRLGWMMEHGYETVGKTRNDMMLCLAGRKYGDLFRKRVTDFVSDDGVGYFKWDGMQFSCSESDHGHPVGIYSRRAVMESVIDKCRAVRERNPDVFLNITSGTWLSPWWVKYANTIWMQGADYGYSDVPSISRRDAAITYRDFILYDDFNNLDLWFPIANLMTHGIIKGKLQLLGSAEEPLDKFTDDVLLYFARGISMYELYISPDILSEGEWDAMSGAIHWAKDRFDVLRHTVMVGGNPMNRETYGYVHYNGRRGIVAARNPFIESSSLKVTLDPALGLDPSASGLVIEKVYPTRWISPQLHAAGDVIDLPLEGYETAVYELYPLEEAECPLPAGVTFEMEGTGGGGYTVAFHSTEGGARFLNRGEITAPASGDEPGTESLSLRTGDSPEPVTKIFLRPDRVNPEIFTAGFRIDSSVRAATFAVLLTPADDGDKRSTPAVSVLLDGVPATVRSENRQGKSHWFTIPLTPGPHRVETAVEPGKDDQLWTGTAGAWVIADQAHPLRTVRVMFAGGASDRPLPPRTREPGVTRRNIRLGQVQLKSVSRTVWLDELDLAAMRCGWSTPKEKLSVDGNPITIAGRKYERGVGTHAMSSMLLRLDGKGERFVASVGVDDETGSSKASVAFMVLADRKVIWESGRMAIGDSAKKIDLSLRGVGMLGLLVTDAGDGIDYDHADWGDARVELSSPLSRGEIVAGAQTPARGSSILTPPPAKKPRINGPRVYGVRPGHPFLYTVPATGIRPVRFGAEGLPAGLSIDHTSGRITGTVASAGNFEVTLTATNDYGEDRRPFRVVAGEDISLTPPLGWNSWNCWGGSVSQEKVLSSARAMADKGLIDHGWSYINIDDGWQGVRGGRFDGIQGNRKFADMAGLADSIHAVGLKLGIYSTPWRGTYEGHIGSSCDNEDGTYDWIRAGEANEDYRHKDYSDGRRSNWVFGKYSFVTNDARQWAAWGVDYLKYDWNPNDVPHVKEMADALRGSGRDIILSLSNSAPFERAADLSALAQCWRTTGDIRDTWESMSGIGFSQMRWRPYGRPGHWNDPDMLVVGQVGWGPELHATRLTPDEQYTHISLWSLLAAPLLLGCDLAQLDDFTVGLLTNDEVLEIDQDPLGRGAVLLRRGDGREIWVKDLEDGSKAVGLFFPANEFNEPADYFNWENRRSASIAVTWSELGFEGACRVRDVWRQEDRGVHGEGYTAEVPLHGVVLLRVSRAE